MTKLVNTVFARHYNHMFVRKYGCYTNMGDMFYLEAPKDGYVIRDTIKRFDANALRYTYIQQLNSCNACIVTTSCVHQYGHFNSTMRLVSYDTVICEVQFLSENAHDSAKPYINIIIGEHWNYSRTTVQHVYKFLRKFSITTLQLSALAKYDKRIGNGHYSYNKYPFTNNVGNLYTVQFCDACVYDFAYGNAQHFVDRMITNG